MKLRFLMWADKWWTHKLKLPGKDWVCNTFDAWVTGTEDDWKAGV